MPLTSTRPPSAVSETTVAVRLWGKHQVATACMDRDAIGHAGLGQKRCENIEARRAIHRETGHIEAERTSQIASSRGAGQCAAEIKAASFSSNRQATCIAPAGGGRREIEQHARRHPNRSGIGGQRNGAGRGIFPDIVELLGHRLDGDRGPSVQIEVAFGCFDRDNAG